MWNHQVFGRLPALVAAFIMLPVLSLLLAACAPGSQPLARLCPADAGDVACAEADGTIAALDVELQAARATNARLVEGQSGQAQLPPVLPSPNLPFLANPPQNTSSPPDFMGVPATIVSENPFPPPPTAQPPAIAMVLTPTRDPNMPTFDPNRRSTAIVETATAQELDRRVRLTATEIARQIFELTPGPDPREQTATAIAATIIASSATPHPPDFRVELAADPTFTAVEDCDAQVIRGTISGELDREVLVRVVGEGIDRVRVTDGTAWEIPLADEPTAATYTLTVLTLDNQLVSEVIEVGFDGTCERTAAEVNFSVRDPFVPTATPTATTLPTRTPLTPPGTQAPAFTPAPPTPVP